MDYHPILNDKLVRRLVQLGSELDQIEPLLSPPLRDALVDLQRNAADAYASGDWTVLATGEKVTVQQATSHKENDTAPSLKQQAQQPLGGAYLGVSDQGKSVLKTLMQDLGLSPSAPKMQPLMGSSLH